MGRPASTGHAPPARPYLLRTTADAASRWYTLINMGAFMCTTAIVLTESWACVRTDVDYTTLEDLYVVLRIRPYICKRTGPET